MKFLKPFKFLIPCLMMYAGLLALSTSASADTMDRIVAKVNDQIITQSALEERVSMKMMVLRKNNIQPMPSHEQLLHQQLEIMIEEELLVNAGRQRGFVIDEKRVTQAIKDIEKSNGVKEGELERMLRAESSSPEDFQKKLDDYRKQIGEQILMSEARSYEIRQRVSITDKEVREFYDLHIREFWLPAKLKLRHILFLMGKELLEEHKQIKLKKAQIALKKIRAGEDFAVVAKEYSEDISANTGGDLGEIQRGKMLPEFEKAAFDLKEGQVSGLVKTPYGLHIIKVDKIIPGKTIPFDDLQGRIKNQLLDKKAKSEYLAYIKELKDQAFIEIKLPTLPKTMGHQAHQEKTVPGSNPAASSGIIHKEGTRLEKDKDTPTLTSQKEFPRFQTFEDKLRHLKQMRDSDKISQEDYQRMKNELLKQL